MPLLDLRLPLLAALFALTAACQAALPPIAEGPTLPLVRPLGTPHRVVTGTVQLDAAYAAAVAGAQLAGEGQDRHVRVGGAVLSNGGGLLLGNHAAGLVNPGVSRLRATRRLLASAAPGETLPAAGVTVTVRSLLTGLSLPVGTSVDGAPTYIVTTDERGGFTTYLPQPEGGVVFEARVRNAEGQVSKDPGLIYDLCPPQDAASVAVDEDTAAVCRLLWLSLFNVLRDALADTPDGLHRRVALDAFAPLIQAAMRADLNKATPETFDAVLGRCTEALIGSADPWTVRAGDAGAMETLVTQLRRTREAATARVREFPSALETWPDFVQTNAERPPGTPAWSLRKPADFNRFLVDAYTARLALQPDLTPLLGPNAGREPAWRDATTALISAQFSAVQENRGGVRERLTQIIEAWRPSATPQ
jgi:hypothetical protein